MNCESNVVGLIMHDIQYVPNGNLNDISLNCVLYQDLYIEVDCYGELLGHAVICDLI